ncbi:hypothetical protein ACJA3S_04465 [Pseudomonas sp. KnCO4]|uniref:hypothetical protein n=1 Tax=Pseudomonas sp. KnCO4 TaxID=3381355 RepID=UPI0038782EFC
MSHMLSRSFTAHISVLGEEHHKRLGVTLSSVPAQSGWLTTVEGDERSLPIDFRFDFIHRESEARLLYMITSVTREGGYWQTQLNLSRNGYAGLYRVDAEDTRWKVEPLNAWNDESDLQFHLRTASGERLGRTHDGLLNACEGNIVVFKAKVIGY